MKKFFVKLGLTLIYLAVAIVLILIAGNLLNRAWQFMIFALNIYASVLGIFILVFALIVITFFLVRAGGRK